MNTSFHPRILVLSLGCSLFFFSTKAQSQSKYKTTIAHQQNVSAYVGLGQTRFLNPVFKDHLKAGTLKPGPGFALGFSYVTYPIMVSFGYFHSGYKVHDYNWQYDDKSKVTHSGFEIGANLMLLPQIKYVQPYIGAAYHNSALAVQISDSEDGKNKGLPKSSLKMSTAVWRAGISTQINRLLGFRLDYQRPMNARTSYKAFNKFGACITFNLLQ